MSPKTLHKHFHGSLTHKCPKRETARWPLTGKRINKLRSSHRMEYSLTTKGNKLLTHGTDTMNLK